MDSAAGQLRARGDATFVLTNIATVATDTLDADGLDIRFRFLHEYATMATNSGGGGWPPPTSPSLRCPSSLTPASTGTSTPTPTETLAISSLASVRLRVYCNHAR